MIIGAGWAGIRAVETLLNEGVDSVLVLEAGDYVGGRSKSINLDDSTNDPSKVGDDGNVPYDVGSEWLYSQGNSQEETLGREGYLGPAVGNDQYTAVPLQTGVFYRQTRDEGTGELTAEVAEGARNWLAEVWGGFLRFREEEWNDLDGVSYGGEWRPCALCRRSSRRSVRPSRFWRGAIQSRLYEDGCTSLVNGQMGIQGGSRKPINQLKLALPFTCLKWNSCNSARLRRKSSGPRLWLLAEVAPRSHRRASSGSLLANERTCENWCPFVGVTKWGARS